MDVFPQKQVYVDVVQNDNRSYDFDGANRLFLHHPTSSTRSQVVRCEVRPERYGLVVSGDIELNVSSVKQRVLFVESKKTKK